MPPPNQPSPHCSPLPVAPPFAWWLFRASTDRFSMGFPFLGNSCACLVIWWHFQKCIQHWSKFLLKKPAGWPDQQTSTEESRFTWLAGCLTNWLTSRGVWMAANAGSSQEGSVGHAFWRIGSYLFFNLREKSWLGYSEPPTKYAHETPI